MASVGAAERTADTVAALGEVQPVADIAPSAVCLDPFYKVHVHAALHDEVFEEVADLVLGERAHKTRAEPEAFAEAARHVVLAAAFPSAERAGGSDAVVAGVEAEHDFAE